MIIYNFTYVIGHIVERGQMKKSEFILTTQGGKEY